MEQPEYCRQCDNGKCDGLSGRNLALCQVINVGLYNDGRSCSSQALTGNNQLLWNSSAVASSQHGVAGSAQFFQSISAVKEYFSNSTTAIAV